MISLQAFKKTLGKQAKNLTEEQIQQILEMQYKIANVLFDVWLKKHSIAKHKVHQKDGNIAIIEWRYLAFSLVYV